MAHTPINHPARPVYRAFSGLVGGYLVVFGILGLLRAEGGFFTQDDILVLGQGTNRAFAVLSIALGVLIVVATVLGRNIDVAVNKVLAYALMALGLAGLAVLKTDANFLNFSVATTIVLMVIGLVLLMAGMYGKVGTDEEHTAWQEGRLLL